MSDNDGSIAVIGIVILFLSIFIISAATASASRESYIDYWTGKSESELLSVMGAPTKVHKMDEGKILVYDRGTYARPIDGGWHQHHRRHRWWHRKPTYVIEKSTVQYFVNDKGVIYRVLLD